MNVDFGRLAIGDGEGQQEDPAVAARWAATLDEARRQAARHAAEIAARARCDESWVDVSYAGTGASSASSSSKQSTSTTSKTSTTTTMTSGEAVPRDSGDAWRQEEWHIAFIVLVRCEGRPFSFCQSVCVCV